MNATSETAPSGAEENTGTGNEDTIQVLVKRKPVAKRKVPMFPVDWNFLAPALSSKDAEPLNVAAAENAVVDSVIAQQVEMNSTSKPNPVPTRVVAGGGTVLVGCLEGGLPEHRRRRGNPTSSGPWCWQQKKARRLIRERMDGNSKTVYVLSVYDALTEIASDKSAETFQTSHPYLAGTAGCSVSQLKVVLEELEEAGLVEIATPKLKGPCKFTLLTIPGDESVSRSVTNDSCITPSDSRNATNVSHKPKSSAVATVEESQEENYKENQKGEAPPTRPRFVPPSLLEAEAEAVEQGMPPGEGQAFIHHHQSKGWVVGKSPMKDWKAATGTWKRTYDRIQQANPNVPPRTYSAVGAEWETK